MTVCAQSLQERLTEEMSMAFRTGREMITHGKCYFCTLGLWLCHESGRGVDAVHKSSCSNTITHVAIVSNEHSFSKCRSYASIICATLAPLSSRPSTSMAALFSSPRNLVTGYVTYIQFWSSHGVPSRLLRKPRMVSKTVLRPHIIGMLRIIFEFISRMKV